MIKKCVDAQFNKVLMKTMVSALKMHAQFIDKLFTLCAAHKQPGLAS